MSLEPSEKPDPKLTPARVLQNYQLGIKIALFVLAELFLVNLMIYTAAYNSAAPPASSGNFYMWGVGCIIFEVFLIAFLLTGMDGRIKGRLILALTLIMGFALTTLTGLSGVDQAFPWDRVVSAVLLIPMSGVVAGTPILTIRFLTNYRVRSRLIKDKPNRTASIRTILLATAVFAFALVAAQKSLGRISAMPVGGLHIESIQFVVGFWVTLAIASGCGALMLFGLKGDKNLHKHCLIETIGVNLFVWLILLSVNFFVSFNFDLLTGAFYYTIAMVAAMIHVYLLTYALELLGYQMTNVQ